MKIPNQIKEIRYLIENKYDWITCLIYGETVEIYGSNIGLNSERDFEDFNEWFNDDEGVVLIDVREEHEYQAAHIDGILIPEGMIEQRLDEIPHQGRVVVHCRSGARSARAISMLRDTYGYHNLYNLKGGILAWRDAYAPDLPVV